MYDGLTHLLPKVLPYVENNVRVGKNVERQMRPVVAG
jgi:hypothetical protein